MSRPKPLTRDTSPNREHRKMLEQRSRDATRPATPEVKTRWPIPMPDSDGARSSSSGTRRNP